MLKTVYSVKLSPTRIAIADLSWFEGVWWINRINVPKEFRGNGIGTQILTGIIEDADAEQATLRLSINPTGKMGHVELKAWYERYGFEAKTDLNGEIYFERTPK